MLHVQDWCGKPENHARHDARDVMGDDRRMEEVIKGFWKARGPMAFRMQSSWLTHGADLTLW